MKQRKKILAISGSTRQASVNALYLRAIAALSPEAFVFEFYEGLAALPHFNPDLDQDPPPPAVADLRRRLREADGILICTPEYAMGVPGSLKNALDWTVSSCAFSHKPVALVTASSSGKKGHAALLETLLVIEARMEEDTKLLISFARTKINEQNEITDPETLAAIQSLIRAFEKMMEEERPA